jgi:hypothetical protein
MAKSRIYDLISQINTILGKPVSQILSGLSPKYYDRILRQRDALLGVRSQLEQALSQNQDISEEDADSFQARIRELEISMEQPSTLFNEVRNDTQPRVDLPKLSNQPEKLEPERLNLEKLNSEKSKPEQIEVTPLLIEKLSERVTEKIYNRLLAVVTQEQRSLITIEMTVLEATKQNLSQEITELQNLKEERLREFNLQQQQHQEAYADSVNFLNQFLHEGIRDPLRNAATQMGSLKNDAEQVNQAIAQISVDRILEQTNAETQIFLQEFVTRLNALFAKTLPVLAGQIKSLREEVDLGVENWQGKFNTYTEAMTESLSQFQQQINQINLPNLDQSSSSIPSQPVESESLAQILPRLSAIEENLSQVTSTSNQAFAVIQLLEQQLAELQQTKIPDSEQQLTELQQNKAQSEKTNQTQPESIPESTSKPEIQTEQPSDRQINWVLLRDNRTDLEEIPEEIATVENIEELAAVEADSQNEPIGELLNKSPSESLSTQELQDLNREIVEEIARELAREASREAELENVRLVDSSVTSIELELDALLNDLLLDVEEDISKPKQIDETEIQTSIELDALVQVIEPEPQISPVLDYDLSIELEDLLSELADSQNATEEVVREELPAFSIEVSEIAIASELELSELSQQLLQESLFQNSNEELLSLLEPEIDPQILEPISDSILEANLELISGDFNFNSLNSFADSEEPGLEISKNKSEPEAQIIPIFSTDSNIPLSTQLLKTETKEKWILGIDFDSSKLQGWLYELNSARQIELLPMEAIAEVLNPVDYSTPLQIENFKPFLQAALPYLTDDTWQPQIQWQRSLNLSLQSLVSGFQDLLYKLEIPRSIRANIQNVVLAHPANWSDIYSLNLREAVLAAELVSQPGQILVIDQAIAPLLVMIQENTIEYPALLIDASADHVCLSLVGVANQRNGNNPAIATRSYDYGGFAIAQDILTQLIYSRWRNAKNLNRDACNLNHLSLPTLGLSDLVKRSLLRQAIAETEAGQQLWQAANQIMQQLLEPLESSLSSPPEYTFEIMDFNISISHREVENQILQLFIQRIGHEINTLFQKAGGNATEIRQVLLCGSSSYFSSLDRWLRSKFSQAEIQRLPDNVIAQGLAIAPLFTPMLDLSRQQYSDYFLLSEICRLSLEKEFTAKSLIQQLRNQGINTNVCEARILQILNGEISAQLFPWQELETKILFNDSLLHRELCQRKLFELNTEGIYQPNSAQLKLLQTYLELISGYLHQNLAEPLVLSLVTS